MSRSRRVPTELTNMKNNKRTVLAVVLVALTCLAVSPVQALTEKETAGIIQAIKNAPSAELAVKAIVERLDEGRVTPKETVLDPTLVVRGTTGAPRPSTATCLLPTH